MRRVSVAMAGLMLALLVLSPVMAADKAKKEKKAKPARMPGVAAASAALRGVTLTEEQKEKVKEIGTSFNEKLVAIQAKMNDGISPEAKKQRAEALAKAKAEGKTGKELREAVKGIGEPSKEQKAAMKEVMEERKAVAKEMKDALLAILTDDQRAQVQAKAAPKKEKKNKDK